MCILPARNTPLILQLVLLTCLPSCTAAWRLIIFIMDSCLMMCTNVGLLARKLFVCIDGDVTLTAPNEVLQSKWRHFAQWLDWVTFWSKYKRSQNISKQMIIVAIVDYHAIRLPMHSDGTRSLALVSHSPVYRLYFGACIRLQNNSKQLSKAKHYTPKIQTLQHYEYDVILRSD